MTTSYYQVRNIFESLLKPFESYWDDQRVRQRTEIKNTRYLVDQINRLNSKWIIGRVFESKLDNQIEGRC